MRDFNVKLKPILSLLSGGGGGSGFISVGGLGPEGIISGEDSTLIDDNTHWIRVWTTASTHDVVVTENTPVQYLVAGAGGSGAYFWAGGGGAGRVIFDSGTIAAGTNPARVGLGTYASNGNGEGKHTPRTGQGIPGEDSYLGGVDGGPIYAPGGGGGGGTHTQPPAYNPGRPGNAGGGGARNSQTPNWGSGASGTPFGGSGSPANATYSGGGGGASGPGGVSSPNNASGRQGGQGVAVPWMPPAYGTPGPSPGRWFGGGGSGSILGTDPPSPGLPGGAGGGGMGVNNNNTGPTAAVENTGSGGGGGGGNGPGPGNSKGSHGIIAIRWAK